MGTNNKNKWGLLLAGELIAAACNAALPLARFLFQSLL